MKKVLVACEESQVVCTAFRSRCFEAYSADIQEPSGGHPEWHILGDVRSIINGGTFRTMNGAEHTVDRWDLIIAHPPCTYLAVTGNRWFNVDKYGEKAIKRAQDREDAFAFFMEFAYADCDRIAIENPIGVVSTRWRKPDQIIHPYYFAESEDDINCERKATCLWTKGLPNLTYSAQYAPRVIKYKNGQGTDSPWHMSTMGLPASERSKVRSRTFYGIAAAMADQWGAVLMEEKND